MRYYPLFPNQQKAQQPPPTATAPAALPFNVSMSTPKMKWFTVRQPVMKAPYNNIVNDDHCSDTELSVVGHEEP